MDTVFHDANGLIDKTYPKLSGPRSSPSFEEPPQWLSEYRSRQYVFPFGKFLLKSAFILDKFPLGKISHGMSP